MTPAEQLKIAHLHVQSLALERDAWIRYAGRLRDAVTAYCDKRNLTAAHPLREVLATGGAPRDTSAAPGNVSKTPN